MPSSFVWTAPPVGSLKLNSNAGFIESELRATVGVVVRDNVSSIVLTASQGFNGVLTPVQVELRAILMMLKVSYNEGLRVRDVETYSLLAVWEILKGAGSTSEWHNLILDIIRLKELCNVFSLKFVKRDANLLAHDIAKEHGLHKALYVWHHGMPLLLLID